jgi:hypothetical protein
VRLKVILCPKIKANESRLLHRTLRPHRNVRRATKRWRKETTADSQSFIRVAPDANEAASSPILVVLNSQVWFAQMSPQQTIADYRVSVNQCEIGVRQDCLQKLVSKQCLCEIILVKSSLKQESSKPALRARYVDGVLTGGIFHNRHVVPRTVCHGLNFRLVRN